MRPEEAAAQRILQLLRPEWGVQYVESQSNGECDFVVTIDGVVAPLEVTRYTNAQYRAFHAQVRGKGVDGQAVARDACGSDWIVMPSRGADMREVRARVAQYLVAIESEGRSRFDINEDGEASSAVLAMWQDLRVPDGFQVPGDEGLIHFELPSEHALLSADQVAEAVREVAHRPDNLRKLSQSAVAQGQLFVFVDFYSYPADEAMRANLLPLDPPSLPDSISFVWLARALDGGRRHQVWLGSASKGWSSLGVITTPRDAA